MSSDFYTSSILPFAGIIIKICRAYTNTQEDFEDYYQEVCLQIWRTKDNFKEVLTELGFSSKGDLFTKKFKETNAYLKVDFKAEKLIYPEDKGFTINEKQTCNFNQNENFVFSEWRSVLSPHCFRFA